MISDHYTESWTVQKLTETNTNGEIVRTYPTDTSIGTAGVISAHTRQLSARELVAMDKQQVSATHRLYTGSSGITETHRLVNASGDVYSVIAVDNPHNLGEFYQIDLLRSDVERESDT